MAKNSFDPVRLATVKACSVAHPEWGARLISRATGIHRASIDRMLRYLRQGEQYKGIAPNVPAVGHKYDSKANTAEAVSRNPKTLAGLLKVCDVDTTTWRVDHWICNKWEVGTKLPDGGVLRTPLYQVKAFLERIPGAEDAQAIKDTIQWIRGQNVVPLFAAERCHRLLKAEDETLLELTIPDLHYGKLAWDKETGKNYDNEIAASLYMDATRNLWHKAAVFPVAKVLLVVGSDFFNVNGAANATAAGTPQSEDGRWPKTFRRGVALIKEQIEFLRGKVDKVDVMVIRGNHDAERMYMAGEVLRAIYEKVPQVKVTNDPIKRQYFQWGTVLLGMTHGDGLKHDKLPLLMAGEAPEMWSKTTHREWHVGHFHSKKETQYHVGTEHSAVRVRILPSLTTADDWHYTNGYVGAKQAAEAYLWGKKAGYIGHLSWSPPEIKA